MKLDLKAFKKVHEDGEKARLAHPDGHEIHVLKKSLKPDQLTALSALPFVEGGDRQNYAGGGDVAPDQMTPEMVQNLQTPGAAPPAQQAQQAPSPQSQDPFGMQAYQDALQSGINKQETGINWQAAAEGELGNKQGAIEENAAKQGEDLRNLYQQHYNDLDNERKQFVQDIQNSNIDPQHYMHNKDTLGKVSTGIGLLLGGLGSGMSGHNQALDFLNANIDRDIAAQQTSLGKKKSLLEANLHQFGNLRDATEMTRIMMNDVTAANIKAAADRMTSPLAKARAAQAIGQLQQQNAPLQQQLAMKKAALSGQAAGIDPATQIRFLVPQNQQEQAFKDYDVMQKQNALREEALQSFDHLADQATKGALTPADRKSAINSVAGGLVRMNGARYNQDNAQSLVDSQFPALGDIPSTVANKRARLLKEINGNTGSGLLQSFGIRAPSQGQYDSNGLNQMEQKALQQAQQNPQDPRSAKVIAILRSKLGG